MSNLTDIQKGVDVQTLTGPFTKEDIQAFLDNALLEFNVIIKNSQRQSEES